MGAAMVLGIGGAVTQAAGGIFAGLSQIQAGKSAYRQAKTNAARLTDAANFNADRERVKFRKVGGAQMASYASSGIDASTGSAADVQAETAFEGELAAFMARFGLDTQADRILQEGEAARDAGKIRGISSILGGVGGSLLTGSKLASA